MMMIQSPRSVDPPPPIDSSHSSSSSLHSLELSVSLVLVTLLVTLFITIFIYFLIRRLRRVSPVLDSSAARDCSICLSPFEPEDKVRHLPLCSHSFHEDCISVSNQTCPLCRSPLSASEDAATATTASLAENVGHDSSRSWLRDLSRGISSRALSFRGSSSRFFTGSSRRAVVED
ncbi:unnamed protein product [Arabis nemorensis]|uniref:RING-type E3 ubiquitin transferase n=1 Tax=Arabis nemorensis TaxID=586526 RepID=A0A565AQM6_9BRAS|nr:unnamed protein product [Arabis nemorensis]